MAPTVSRGKTGEKPLGILGTYLSYFKALNQKQVAAHVRLHGCPAAAQSSLPLTTPPRPPLPVQSHATQRTDERHSTVVSEEDSTPQGTLLWATSPPAPSHSPRQARRPTKRPRVTRIAAC